MKKPLSSCCEKPVKVNMASADGRLFCLNCGNDCEVSSRREPFKASTISKVRKPTGEREVFVRLWAKCGGKSVISGAQLLPPEHPLFHYQFAHCLNKGTYPEERLNEANIFPVTVEEHEYQTKDPGGCRKNPLWLKFWAFHEQLKRSKYGDRAL